MPPMSYQIKYFFFVIQGQDIQNTNIIIYDIVECKWLCMDLPPCLVYGFIKASVFHILCYIRA